MLARDSGNDAASTNGGDTHECSALVTHRMDTPFPSHVWELFSPHREGSSVARLKGQVLLPMELLRKTAFLSKLAIDAAVLEETLGSAPFLLLGSTVKDRGGVTLLADVDEHSRRPISQTLLRAAVHYAAERDLAVLAVNVPDEQIRGLTEAPGVRIVLLQTLHWNVLHVGAASCVSSFLQSLDAKTRRTWRQDLGADLSGITCRIETLTAKGIRELAPLVASVRAANGTPTHPITVEYELEETARRYQAPLLAFACRRDGSEDLLAASVAVDLGEMLEVIDVGMLADHAQRSLLYRTAVFVQPLNYALGRGISRITFGYGHDLPKRSRGAIGEPMHTLALIHTQETGPRS